VEVTHAKTDVTSLAAWLESHQGEKLQLQFCAQSLQLLRFVCVRWERQTC
jgi:hypothetical protein